MIPQVLAWLRDRPYLTALIVLAAVAVPGFVRVEALGREQARIVECVQEWGDATGARSSALAAGSARRAEALDELVRAVAAEDPAGFERALAGYLAASDAYDRAVAEHPVPAPPTLTCR